MENNLTVYSFRRCPFAMRVRMALHEKNLEFKTIDEDLKNFSPELKKMHPEAKIPVLVHGDKVIYESAIITEYIEDQFPDKPLMPKTAGEKCDVRLWTYWCNQFYKVAVDQYKYGTSRFTEEQCEGCEQRLEEYLLKIETSLNESRFLVGDEITLADIHVFPFVRQLSRVANTQKIFDKIPATNKWLEGLLSRPSFEKTIAKVKNN